MGLNIRYAAPSVAPYGSKINITENGEYDVTDYAVANVNVEGGGGSSDFAFANVTVVNNISGTAHGVLCANYIEAPAQAGAPFNAVTRGYAGASMENNPVTAKVIMYQGYALVQIGEANDPDATYEVEGNGRVFQKNNILITGDCTITINPAS